MVQFKIKGDIDKDVYVKETSPDLMDGSATTIEIAGGLQARSEYLMQGTIPPKPTFGSAKFTGVDFSIYNASLTPGDMSPSLPELSAYKLKDGYTITEGFAKLNSSHGTGLHAVSAVANGYESIVDYFDGQGSLSETQSPTFYESRGNTTVGKQQPYTNVYDLKSRGVYIRAFSLNDKVGDTDEYDKYSKIRKNFGLTAAEIGLLNIP